MISMSSLLLQKNLKQKVKLAVPLLRKFVEGEGFTFVDFSKVDPSSIPPWHILEGFEDVIFFFGREQLKALFPKYAKGLQVQDFNCGVIFNVAANAKGGHPPLKISAPGDISKQLIVNWLKGASAWECIVCFEDKETSQKTLTAKNARLSCICGAMMCFGCEIDLILDHNNGDDFTFECPNCRKCLEPSGRLQVFFDVLAQTPSLEGMSEAQLAFIKKYADYDGSAKALKGVRRTQQDLHSRFLALTPMIIRAEGWNPYAMTDANKTTLGIKLIEEFKKEIEAKQKRKETESECKGPAASSVHSFSRDACANCGKAFWDKKERQRAPKCPKCSRAFYCNAKCRKAHKKKHSQLCDAKKKKRVPKKKQRRATAKAGCAPY